MDRKPVVGAKKINKNEYVVLRTGEIKQYQESENKQSSNLRRTFNQLRYLIRTNFTNDSDNQLFVTLTYSENMTDEKLLYKDFDKFMKRLKYKFPQHKLDYIVVAEPQGRGSWHMHVMLKSDQPVLIIPKEDMSAIWGDENIVRQALIKELKMDKRLAYDLPLSDAYERVKGKMPSGYKPLAGHGYTATERLKSDDVGSYYVAYFTDLTAEVKSSSSSDKSKKRKKGARLHFYPKNFKFYRCSRGIKKPDVEQVEYGKVLEDYGSPVYTSTYDIVVEDGFEEKIINKIQHEHFKKD